MLDLIGFLPEYLYSQSIMDHHHYSCSHLPPLEIRANSHMGVLIRSTSTCCGHVTRKHVRTILWGQAYRTNNARLRQRIRDFIILLLNLTLRTSGEFRQTGAKDGKLQETYLSHFKLIYN